MIIGPVLALKCTHQCGSRSVRPPCFAWSGGRRSRPRQPCRPSGSTSGPGGEVRQALREDTACTGRVPAEKLPDRELETHGVRPPWEIREMVGPGHNFSRFGGLVTGELNEISGVFASVIGGDFNTATNRQSAVIGSLAMPPVAFYRWSAASRTTKPAATSRLTRTPSTPLGLPQGLDGMADSAGSPCVRSRSCYALRRQSPRRWRRGRSL
jgi:hypothetical protein